MSQIVKTLALIFPLIVVGCAGAVPSNSPTSLGTRYSIMFPSTPSCERTQIDAPWGKTPKESCTYFDERIGHAYSADYIVLPESMAQIPAEQLLLGAASGAAANSNSEITNQQSIDVANYPALDVTLYPKKNGFVAFVRYILVDNHLVTITADGYKERSTPQDVKAFISSLRVVQ
jgi:hypothetical protein